MERPCNIQRFRTSWVYSVNNLPVINDNWIVLMANENKTIVNLPKPRDESIKENSSLLHFVRHFSPKKNDTEEDYWWKKIYIRTVTIMCWEIFPMTQALKELFKLSLNPTTIFPQTRAFPSQCSEKIIVSVRLSIFLLIFTCQKSRPFRFDQELSSFQQNSMPIRRVLPCSESLPY